MKLTRTDKGQTQYGGAIRELNGREFYVIDSTLATASACRVYTRNPTDPREQDECALHLNKRQAASLVARLQEFLKRS